MNNFKKYRWFYTSEDTLVVGGKNAEQNDELLEQVVKGGKDYVVMHTAAPGSPFAILTNSREKITARELEECAVFTACFSQEWKKKKKRATVHIFTTMQLTKEKGMKTGSWRVNGPVKKVSAPLQLALTVQKKVLRAVPISAAREKLALICPGQVDKSTMLAALQLTIGDRFSAEDILGALPAGGVKLWRE